MKLEGVQVKSNSVLQQSLFNKKKCTVTKGNFSSKLKLHLLCHLVLLVESEKKKTEKK